MKTQQNFQTRFFAPQKRFAFLMGTILLLALLILASGCATQEKAMEKMPEAAGEDAPQEPAEEPALEPQPVEEAKVEPVIAEPVLIAEEKKEFQIFDPVLTYDGAYNGPLYGTSEQVGAASMDSYFENLDRNGINFFIGMFAISGEPSADTLISDQGLGEVIDAAQKHPYRIIPFFNPGIGGEEVEQYLGKTLTGWYTVTLAASQKVTGKNFIRGLGEVETQEWQAGHNDPKVRQLIDLAQGNDIHFMFHPVAGKIDDVEKIADAYPETTFLIHMYREDLAKSMTRLIKILQEHDNLYFSMDAAHILFVDGNDIIYTYDSKDKQSSINKFVSALDSKEKSIVNDAIKAYKPLVDAVPDKVMWGTEIGPEYAFDPKVFDRAIKASRLVIAGFDKEHQEAVGYKNALRVFGQGVVADPGIKVIDTRSWPECTSTKIGSCDESCGIPDTDSMTSEQEACYQNCIIAEKCREIPEMDTG